MTLTVCAIILDDVFLGRYVNKMYPAPAGDIVWFVIQRFSGDLGAYGILTAGHRG